MRPINNIVLLLFIIIASFKSFGQNQSKIDSLNGLLSTASGIDRYNVLNAIGFEYRLSDPDSTIYYCTHAYEIGVTLNLQKDLSRPLSFIGLANAYRGDYKTSFEFHTRAIEVAQQQEDSIQLAYSHNNFGRLFFDQGDMTRAYNHLVSSRIIFENLNDPTGLAYVYRSLASIHKSQGDLPKALRRALQAYELRVQLNDPRTLLSALMELGLVYSEMDNSEEANKCFEKADSIATRINDEISQAEIQMGWAEFLIAHNDTASGHILAHHAFSMVKDTENVRLLPRALLLMGHVHFEINEFNEARVYLEKAIQSTLDSHLDIQRDAYLYLSKIHERAGRTSEATFAFNKHLIIKESLQSIELARQIEKLQFQLEIEKMERENELLKINDASNDSIIRQQQLENIILIVVVTFITALFVMQLRNSTKRKNNNEKLSRQNHEIDVQRKEIAKQNEILETRNQELSELNHEKDTLMNIVAHDLKSPLNHIKGLSELIEMGKNLSQDQVKYMGLLKESTHTGLDLISDLLDVNALEANREPNYSYFNLGTLLEERVSVFQSYAKTKSIILKSEIQFQELFFLDQKYLTRIIDNLISNAIKFSSENSTVEVSIAKRKGLCSIKVKDQGPGFIQEDLKFLYHKFKKLSARPTAGESSNGLGLAIVKILVERLGGKIDLQSEPGKGSTFEILFPISSTLQA
ncbi:MAG: ATP-binding protein [Cyclobacteriaceae bacterium]|nr:ATP-binding protein [Cyclobacteriaceae bacterium]